MKLYYSPGACSFGPHLALRETGIKFDLERVDLRAKKTEKGTDFWTVNPGGFVPVLELDDGEILTEGAVILQYLADRKPRRRLAAKAGTMERYRLQELLNFIATELHKGFSPLFRDPSPEVKAQTMQRLEQRLGVIDKKLAGKQFLMGDEFTVADIYMCTMINWCRRTGIDLAQWPNLAAYDQRLSARPKVKATRKAEGLAA